MEIALVRAVHGRADQIVTMTNAIKLRLPFPPSLNRIWRAVAGRVVLSKLARQWTNDAPAYLPSGRVVPLKGRLRVDLTLCAPAKLRGTDWDVMNREKLLCDLLTKQRVWLDDSQVDSFHIERGEYDERGKGYVDILITTL